MFELFDSKADFDIQIGTNLPHWYQRGVTYFVTFRTEDSIPASVSRLWYARRSAWLLQHGIDPQRENWKEQLRQLSVVERKQFHNTFSQEYMDNLDKGLGNCVLRQSSLSKIVADSLQYFDGQRYHMGDYVVMPNHIHLLTCLLNDTEIRAQCYSWKKFTAGKINKVIGRTGRFWQEESFDHLVRSAEQFEAIQRYIENNPKNLEPDEYILFQRTLNR